MDEIVSDVDPLKSCRQGFRPVEDVALSDLDLIAPALALQPGGVTNQDAKGIVLGQETGHKCSTNIPGYASYKQVSFIH